jgi:hypothetical protein
MMGEPTPTRSNGVVMRMVLKDEDRIEERTEPAMIVAH